MASIGIFMHATFLLLLVWVAVSHLAQGHGLYQAAGGMLLILSVFGTVVLHELGHALTAKRFGVRTRDITLLPIGGVARLSTAKLKTLLGGLTVRQAMITDFRTLNPGAPVRRAVELTLSGFQQDFPVVDGSEVVGVVTHSDVLKALAERGPEVGVDEIMHRSFAKAAPTEIADVAFTRLQGCDCRALVVLDEGQLVGLVTAENIGEMLLFDAALSARASRAGSGRS